MRDPHVVSLAYLLVAEPTTSFSPSALPVETETDGFHIRLADGQLTVTMHDHYPSEESARNAAERYLEAWKIRHALAVGLGRPEFHFEFKHADLVDRDPPLPGEPQTIEASAVVHGRAIISASGHTERGAYPAPPSDFALDPTVETLWARWIGYLAGREPLQSMAYFCLTVLQRITGGRQHAASHYGISRRILETIAQLSVAGDATTARKDGYYASTTHGGGARVAGSGRARPCSASWGGRCGRTRRQSPTAHDGRPASAVARGLGGQLVPVRVYEWSVGAKYRVEMPCERPAP